MTYRDRQKRMRYNRRCLKKVLPSYQNPLYAWCGAALSAMQGAYTSVETLERAQELANRFMNGLRYFSQADVLIYDYQISLLALSDDPQALFDRSMQLWGLLENSRFGSGSFSFLTALLMAPQIEPARWRDVIARAAGILSLICEKHRFLVSSDGGLLFMQLALSTQSDEELVSRTEQAFQKLYGYFSPTAGKYVLDAALILALYPGDILEMCKRVLELYNMLTSMQQKKPDFCVLPMLGILAQDKRSVRDLALLSSDTSNLVLRESEDDRFSARALVQNMSMPLGPRLLLGALLTQENYFPGASLQISGVNFTILLQAVLMFSSLSWLGDRNTK